MIQPTEIKVLENGCSASPSLSDNPSQSRENMTSPKLGPIYQEYALMAEYALLQKQKVPGVYVLPTATSSLAWQGVLFVRAGIYQDASLGFTLRIPPSYPDSEPPQLFFEPPIFHPTVDPESGELDLRRQFIKWRRNVNRLWQVLLYARRVFYKIDTLSPWNHEAAALYENDLDLYRLKLSESILECKKSLSLQSDSSASDHHKIRFSEWNPDVHENARQQMLKGGCLDEMAGIGKTAQTSGLSWIRPPKAPKAEIGASSTAVPS